MALELVTGYWGQQHVTAEQDADLNAGIIGNEPCILNVGEKMRAEVVTANKIRIFDGIFVGYGRVCAIEEGAYEDVEIENGTTGLLRNDMIVMKYTKDEETGIEGVSLLVLKGQTGEEAVDPVPNNQDIRAGAFESEMPLYRVRLNGLAIEAVESLCSFPMTINQLKDKLTSGTVTNNLIIHKNDPYLRLKNAQGGDQELGLHYYGAVAGENMFGIYDSTGQTHLMTISQETKEVKFYGTLQVIAAGNNYGKVYAGDKIYMSTDAEGGNLRITPPNGNGNFWEVDAYNGNLRFYHYDATQEKITAQFNWGAAGTVSASFVLNALTATAAGYVLDARQGKVLNDKITALQTTSMGNGTKANSNIPSEGFNCHYTKIGRLVQLSIEFDTGSNTISSQKQKLATGVPIPAYPEQSLGIMHCAYANYSPVSINVTSDGVYTWYCGDLAANASYRGFVVYIANS